MTLSNLLERLYRKSMTAPPPGKLYPLKAVKSGKITSVKRRDFAIKKAYCE